ncbi:winged helix DNA-binding domain-containing protein [Microbacterium sp. SSW1-49]|uniref:Winged helix DNA-binding domain-containing protein n=1 Tax=Microbacterium croceum TaxID=2851645 RepID=A0ABT0FDH4_9MICO|nr:winged helix DNA-binding domain-containing protein [Microbacterium croceum]MCK2036117.1 winged helix DNA-binding domain-containing protein [Microbacterium croceum]
MKSATLLSERLRSHRLTAPARTVTDAAGHLLAVQSQDFIAGRWALAVRTRGEPGLRAVDRAFDHGELVRGWTMRGTLHTVAARDLGWILDVTAGRQRQQAASRHRALGIDDEMVAATVRALTPALRGGGLTRAEIFSLLEDIGIDPSGQRGIHLLLTLTIDGLICQGPVMVRDGVTREQRFVLVDEHIREHARPDDPLAELFVRYITGHGPAGVADFAWWSGLTLGVSREAAAHAAHRVVEVETGLFAATTRPRRSADAPAVHALGAFDEYYISYADRTAVCAPEHLATIGPGKNGMVRPILLARGRVIGCWSHAGASLGAPPELFEETDDIDAVSAAMGRFTRFLQS